MKRSEAREKVFKILFQKDFYDDFSERYEKLAVEDGLKGTQGEYALATIKGVCENVDEIDEVIKANLKGWAFERLTKPAQTLLRLGIYEMIYNKDIPDITAIDEAVKLAYIYCDEKDAVFINGLLNNLHKTSKAEQLY